MKILKKFILEATAFPILIVIYFSTRLFNIMSLPIFTDEAIYTRWSQIARFDPNWRFISLTDGKQPLFVWMDMVLMRFFKDPLMSGRVVSVSSGLATLIGIYFLTREIFKGGEKNKVNSRVVGIIAASLFVIFPFSLVYDRMALYDSLVAALFVWSLYFQILFVRKLRFDIAMVLGFVLGASVLTKSIGFLSIYLTPFLLLLFDYRKKERRERFMKFVLYSLVGIIIANLMYAVLRLSPFFHIIDEKNNIFIYTVKDWLDFTFMSKINNFVSNSRGLFDWFITYFTIPYILVAIAAFFFYARLFKEKIVLVLWFLLPLLSLCVFGKTLYPRYELFMVMPLIPLVALSVYGFFERYKNIFIRLTFLIVILFLPLRMCYYIIFDIAHAPIPRLDSEQYINGWPSGGGVRESVEYFKEQSANSPIFIATQGTFGLMPSAYEIYLIQNHNVTIKGYWPINEKIPDDVAKAAKEIPTFFVFYQDCRRCKFPGDAPSAWPLEKVATYQKGIGNTYLTVYKVKVE